MSKSGRNTLGLRIKAWWLRNFSAIRKDLIVIKFHDGYKPCLFEVMAFDRDNCVLYLGKEKFKSLN